MPCAARTPRSSISSLGLTQLAGIAIRRKQDETALRDSEARFRSLFDNVVDGVYQAAPSGELLSANPALVQMLGLEDGAALGRCNMAEFFVDPKERARLVSELDELRPRAPLRVSAATRVGPRHHRHRELAAS